MQCALSDSNLVFYMHHASYRLENGLIQENRQSHKKKKRGKNTFHICFRKPRELWDRTFFSRLSRTFFPMKVFSWLPSWRDFGKFEVSISLNVYSAWIQNSITSFFFISYGAWYFFLGGGACLFLEPKRIYSTRFVLLFAYWELEKLSLHGIICKPYLLVGLYWTQFEAKITLVHYHTRLIYLIN